MQKNELKLLNLTQHKLTKAQLKDNIIEPDELTKKTIQGLLTIHGNPDPIDLNMKAIGLANIAQQSGCERALVGGKLSLMLNVVQQLAIRSLPSFEANTVRQSHESCDENGTVTKVSVFNYLGLTKMEIYV